MKRRTFLLSFIKMFRKYKTCDGPSDESASYDEADIWTQEATPSHRQMLGQLSSHLQTGYSYDCFSLKIKFYGISFLLKINPPPLSNTYITLATTCAAGNYIFCHHITITFQLRIWKKPLPMQCNPSTYSDKWYRMTRTIRR